jgi:hypothetical protein
VAPLREIPFLRSRKKSVIIHPFRVIRVLSDPCILNGSLKAQYDWFLPPAFALKDSFDLLIPRPAAHLRFLPFVRKKRKPVTRFSALRHMGVMLISRSSLNTAVQYKALFLVL